MARQFKLGNTQWLDDKVIAEHIIASLEKTRMKRPENLYRGVPCDPDRIERILEYGSDRLIKSPDAQKELISIEAGRIFKEDHHIAFSEDLVALGLDSEEERTYNRGYSDPRTIFAHTENNLTSAISYAKKTTASSPLPTILVYDGRLLRQMWEGVSNYQYQFIRDPKKALKALFTLED